MTHISNVWKEDASRINVNMVAGSELQGVKCLALQWWGSVYPSSVSCQVVVIQRGIFQFFHWFYHQSSVFKECSKSLFYFIINLVVPHMIILFSLRGAIGYSSALPSCFGPCRDCIPGPPLTNHCNFHGHHGSGNIIHLIAFPDFLLAILAN